MDKFKLYKKWFWMGVITAVVFPFLGIIYGIFLLVEKRENLKKEGIIILAIAIVMGVIIFLAGRYFNLQNFSTAVIGQPKIGEILPK